MTFFKLTVSKKLKTSSFAVCFDKIEISLFPDENNFSVESARRKNILVATSYMKRSSSNGYKKRGNYWQCIR